MRCIEELGKAHLHVDLARMAHAPAVECVRSWLRWTSPVALNVAGPRESEAPGIFDATRSLLLDVFTVLDSAVKRSP